MLVKEFQKEVAPVLVSMSGGLDSTTLLALAVKHAGKENVAAISFDYGQRHIRELTMTFALTQHYGVRHKLFSIPNFKELARGSSQTDLSVPVPEGHYEDKSMQATVVPNRNSVLLNLAASFAISGQMRSVAYAAHAGDHAIYPDCRPQFAFALAEVFHLCDYLPLHLWAPFLDVSKRAIAELARELEVPIHLTWSCYKGGAKHCGKCGTCVERKEALQGFDPTEYEA